MQPSKDDPKFRALLLRREQEHTVPSRLWESGEKAPSDGIVQIVIMHNRGQITGKEFFRYLYEWMLNIAEHTGTIEDVERLKKAPMFRM